MSDIKVGNKVKYYISDGKWDLFIVKSINGDKALCVSHVNEEKESIFLISELIRVTDDEDS